MSYKTLKGYSIPYPYYFTGKPVNILNEEDKELVSKYKDCFDALQSAEYEVIRSRQYINRLQYENDFMQRLINKHMIGEELNEIQN